MEEKKAESYKQGDDLVRYTLLQREYEQNRALYDGLEQRLETAKVEAGLDALEVDTVDKAVSPGESDVAAGWIHHSDDDCPVYAWRH